MSVSGQKVALGANAKHYSAGTSAGAPLSLIRNTRNFAGCSTSSLTSSCRTSSRFFSINRSCSISVLTLT